MPILRWFHLSRWENYGLIAIASLSFLGIVVAKNDARGSDRLVAPTQTSLRATALEAAPRAKEAAWRKRHDLIKTRADSKSDVLLLGDSITAGWEYKDRWQEHFPRISVTNAGIVSDGVQHILWRTRDGLFAKARPKVVVLLGGTNNMSMHEVDRIAATQAATIRWIQTRSPSTKILLLGVLPMGREAGTARRTKIQKLNARLSRLADGSRVHFLDIGNRLLENDGSLTKSVSFDGIHLTAKGYEIWAGAMAPKLDELLQANRS